MQKFGEIIGPALCSAKEAARGERKETSEPETTLRGRRSERVKGMRSGTDFLITVEGVLLSRRMMLINDWDERSIKSPLVSCLPFYKYLEDTNNKDK